MFSHSVCVLGLGVRVVELRVALLAVVAHHVAEDSTDAEEGSYCSSLALPAEAFQVLGF